MAAKLSARQVLDGFYAAEAAWTQGHASMDKMLDWFGEDCVMLQSKDLPYAGEWKGREGVRAMFAQMGKIYSKINVRPHTVLEQNDIVVVLSNCLYEFRASQREIVKPLTQVVTVDLERGQIAKMQTWYWDLVDFQSGF